MDLRSLGRLRGRTWYSVMKAALGLSYALGLLLMAWTLLSRRYLGVTDVLLCLDGILLSVLVIMARRRADAKRRRRRGLCERCGYDLRYSPARCPECGLESLRRGEAPDNFIDPKTLNPLARSYLREAFRAVASVQSGLASALAMGIRWGCTRQEEVQ